MERKSFELMAPVGSYESLYAAIQGHADAVYFGVGDLNMRSRSASNFDVEDIAAIVAICREHSLKAYLTVNTVIYDNETEKMQNLVQVAKKEGVAAVIASDIAVILYARSIGMEVHISTQCNVTNYESVKFYARYADVLVLARELTLKRVKDIYDRIEADNICGPSGERIKIEMFVHGALCMAVSGKCYLSLHEKNLSANRGACNQICRRAYTVKDRDEEIELDIENEYIMSPKDLCTIGFIDKLMDAGVRVFKIEGRARSAEYVRTVCECYDEALNACLAGDYRSEKIEAWKSRLRTVFNRGFWDGYYLGQRLGEWSEVYGSKATLRREYAGKVTNYFSNLKVAECKLEAYDLEIGDRIIVVGPATGVVECVVTELRLELTPVPRVGKGDVFSLPVSGKVRRGDKIYKMVAVS